MQRFLFLTKLVLLTLLVQIFNSCSEQSISSLNEPKQNISPNNLGNPNNPYDSTGIMHNIALDNIFYIDTNLIVYAGEDIDLEATRDNIADWSIPFFDINFGWNFGEWGLEDFPDLAIATNPDSMFAVLNQNETFSIQFKAKILQYYNGVYNNILTHNNPDSLVNYINSEENDLVNNQTFSNNEKACLFAVLSVAKNSTVFWYNYCQDNDIIINSIGEKTDQLNVTQKTKEAVAAVVISDFIGAYTGFLWGAFVGAGTPAGMAAGAAIGAGRASALSAVHHLLRK